MTEVRISSLCERPCAGIEETGKAPSDAGGMECSRRRKVHLLIDKVYATANLPWHTTHPSPINATHIGKRLAETLHEPFERAGGGRAISPTSPDSTGQAAGKASALTHSEDSLSG